MKVYIVWSHFDNGDAYEFNVSADVIIDIFATKELATAYIAAYDPNVAFHHEEIEPEDETPWVEGNTEWNDDVRHFYRHEGEIVAEEYFTIEEREVITCI